MDLKSTTPSSTAQQRTTSVNNGKTDKKSENNELIQKCLNGEVTNEDTIQAAIALLKEEDKSGEPTAALEIGILMTKLSRPWIRRDDFIRHILFWFKKAATGENGTDDYRAEAHYQMAVLMTEEKIDLSEASKHLEKAHYLGHPTAYKALTELPKTHSSIFYEKLMLGCRETIYRINKNKQEQEVEQFLIQQQEQQEQKQLRLLRLNNCIEQQTEQSTDNLTITEKEAIQFGVAQEFIDQELHGKAIPILEPLANNKHPGAHFLLGQMHQSGMGMTEISSTKALFHFEFAYYNGYEEAGFFLVDYHLSQTFSFKLAKAILCDMVENYCRYDKDVDEPKVQALFASHPTVTNHATDWYDIRPFYLKAALKMAKIYYLTLASSNNDLSELTEKIVLVGDKDTQFELIEWYLIRTDLLQKAISHTTSETNYEKYKSTVQYMMRAELQQKLFMASEIMLNIPMRPEELTKKALKNQSKSDKLIARQLLATVHNNHHIKIPDAYPKTQELMKSISSDIS